jgi:hypothetical protein
MCTLKSIKLECFLEELKEVLAIKYNKQGEFLFEIKAYF